MTVLDVKPETGLYRFRLDTFETEAHSHPAMEILVAEKGHFSVAMADAVHSRLSFAIIDANYRHQVMASDCYVSLIMLEYNIAFAKTLLSTYAITTSGGFYGEKTPGRGDDGLDLLLKELSGPDFPRHEDERISTMLHYLNSSEATYERMIEQLKDRTHLSESRLSHLFKQHMGISIKKYLAWCRLKNTIQHHLSQHEDLFTALVERGFYDQPHFSRTFKSMLGVSPSKAYNSRTVQGLPAPPA